MSLVISHLQLRHIRLQVLFIVAQICTHLQERELQEYEFLLGVKLLPI